MTRFEQVRPVQHGPTLNPSRRPSPTATAAALPPRFLAALAAITACLGCAADDPGAEMASPGYSAPDLTAALATPLPGAAQLTQLRLESPSPAPPLSARRAAALARDVASALSAVGDSEEAPTRVQVVGDSLVLAAGDASVPFDAAVDVARRTVDALHARALAHRPDRATTVWLYSSADGLARGMQRHAIYAHGHGNPLGLYDPEGHVIVMQVAAAGVGTLAHEVAHVLIDADVPLAPPVVSEGLPALFEVADLSDPAHPRFGAHFRLQTLRDALRSKDPAVSGMVRLDAIFATSVAQFYEPASEHLRYACAREALRWMASQGQDRLWAFYATLREHILEDPDGTKSFALVFGKSPAEANDEWRAWLVSRAAEGMQ